MAWVLNPSGRCSWKKILGVVAVLQILLFAIFQAGFFTFSRTHVAKVERIAPIDNTERPILTNLQESFWDFKGLKSEKIFNGTNSFQSNGVLSHGVDLHLEHDELGHTFEVYGHSTGRRKPQIIKNSIAVGLGITSHKSKWTSVTEIKLTFPFFKTLMPSFCSTASSNFSYNFFLAFDKNDKFFTDLANLRQFQSIFYDFVSKECKPYAEYALHFVQCSHNKHPAWAQNDAMIAAYLANMEYFYRINDDTRMATKAWTEIFIKTLAEFNPPNVGVVGPKHRGGNIDILTYDFVHYTHIEIHGYYYTHVFPNWYADRWITDIYRPGRCVKVKFVLLQHTMEKGQRYVHRSVPQNTVKAIVSDGKSVVENYVARLEKNKDVVEDSRKVISMSVYGRDPLFTYGAVRNLQLHKIYMSDWRIRVYLLGTSEATRLSKLLVPEPVIDKLLILGAEIVYLNASFASVDPKLWRFLVAFDKSVDYFLIRDTENRLNEKFELLIREWLKMDTPFFCARDFKDVKVSKPLVGGLMGARRTVFETALGASLSQYLGTAKSNSSGLNGENANNQTSAAGFDPKHSYESLLNDILWPVYKGSAKCFDTVQESQWGNSRPFPSEVAKISNFTLGTSLNQFEEEIKEKPK